MALAVVLLAASGASAQDPLVLLPQAYKLAFENDWVKVVRVHYAPQERLRAHDHTELAAAYVYLNDGGPVVFKHDYGTSTRPPTVTGSFRLYRAVKEIHEVENPNDVPSEFLRVEFKTQPINANTFGGRYHREDNPMGEAFAKVQFENAQLRVTRCFLTPGKTLDARTDAEQPALLVALTGGLLKAQAGDDFEPEPGRVRWLPAGGAASFANAGASAVELLRFDLKTRPVAAP